MAGIGFELRKLLRRESLSGLLSAYAYAGIIGSGPWVLSIVAILIIGFMSVAIVVPNTLVTQFQVSVTYLIALSLILTGAFQLSYTRFTSDRLFEHRNEWILPNLHAVMLAVTLLSGAFGLPCILLLFPEQSLMYRVSMLAGLVLLSNIWMTTIFLSGMKHYKAIVILYGVGYGVSVAAALILRPLGLEGLLGGFVIGQAVLLSGMVALILRNYPSDHFMSFEFFRRDMHFRSLMWVGLFYNLALWADKFLFWFNEPTSQQVIGPLRASVIYDLPVFLAYLSIIPGMAVFLVRLETDFVEYYDAFYNAVREGGSLRMIEEYRNGMVEAARMGLFEIIKIQSIAALLIIAVGPQLLRWLGISELYAPLLNIQVIGVGLQVVFLGILNVFFYLDRRRVTLLLTGLFLVLNLLLTYITLLLSPAYYGYGFAGALLITVLVGFVLLDRTLDRLEYQTFMLQGSS